MPAYTKINLSPDGTEGDGDPIKITDTSGNGTSIHDTLISKRRKDEVWLWVTNTSAAPVEVTMHVGYLSTASAAVDQRSIFTVPPKSGWMLALPGQPLKGNGTTARRIAAYAGSADVINVMGYVNRISASAATRDNLADPS